MRSQSPYMLPQSRIPTPSETIAYQEVPSMFAWLWGSWANSGCEWADRDDLIDPRGRFAAIPGWHRRDFGFSVGFADGHADFVTIKGCERPSENLGLSNYPAGVCAAGTDPYDCDRCVTIRGPGWRLDTLPAPAILTPYFADN